MIFPFSINVVRGHSMQPGIENSSHLVVFRWAYAFSQPKIGDVVVFKGSDGREYVKRVVAAANSDGLIVEGDNRNDSKKLPPVKRKAIIGRVVAIY